MLHEVFICHASEDKEGFVRELAEVLRESRVDVWYDEFSLKPGDSLRRSIDRGLISSTFGVVVLSKSFFGKAWSQWELDGLVQREIYADSPVIVPVWLNVEREDVASFSPSLADRVALKANAGIATVAEGILALLRPGGSTLLIARNQAMRFGARVPIVTDDWWLDVLEHSSTQFDRPWYFPLVSPSAGQSAAERGEALAWVALQEMWQDASQRERISQVSEPSVALEFISNQPGLYEICNQFPNRLAMFAPQLTIPGFGGSFEDIFDKMLTTSSLNRAAMRETGNRFAVGLANDGNGPLCDEELALRHPTFGNYDSANIACGFVQGFGAGLGPTTTAHDYIDYAVWFLSAESRWMPKAHHDFLLEGMKEWAAWLWTGMRSSSFDYQGDESTGALCDALVDAKRATDFRCQGAAEADLRRRVAYSVERLGLPESSDELVQRFLEAGYIESWFARGSRRNRRRNKRRQQ